MKIYVTAYVPHINCLRTFIRLFDRYCDAYIEVDIAEEGEAKSDQLIRLFSSVTDEYVILLEADFYLIDYVSIPLLEEVFKFCIIEGVERFSLQSKNCYEVSNWGDTKHKIEENSVFQATPQVLSQFGLDASIWKKSFLLSHLEKGQSDGTIEKTVSLRICEKSYKIYTLNDVVISYRDAIRMGEQIITLYQNPLRLVCTPGNEKGLYPTGDTSEELLLP